MKGTSQNFSCVVAMDSQQGIGRNGDLPWQKLVDDMKHFSVLTRTAKGGSRNVVIMGRKTWDSIPSSFRPLKDRHNIVVSRGSRADRGNLEFASSFEEALEKAGKHPELGAIFVVGGGQIYAEALAHPRCEAVYVTKINAVYDCDTFLPPLTNYDPDPSWPAQHHRSGALTFTIERLTRRPGT